MTAIALQSHVQYGQEMVNQNLCNLEALFIRVVNYVETRHLTFLTTCAEQGISQYEVSGSDVHFHKSS